MKDHYWGKLILFGEYSMIYDSNALLIPMKRFSARWEQGSNDFLRFSSCELLRFAKFLSEDPILAKMIDTDAFSADLENGWALASDIPVGYGLGSSGSVVAAVYEKYARELITDPLELKKIFSQMESHFHGSSSGIDPLQCYIGKPFCIRENKMEILSDDFLQEDIHIGLLDTRIKSDTKPLVEYFRKQREDAGFIKGFEQEYLPCVSSCMDTLIRGDSTAFLPELNKLSLLQLRFLRKMIPDSVLPLFELKADGGFGIKILGAGGGGYMLLFANNIEAVSEHLGAYDTFWLN